MEHNEKEFKTNEGTFTYESKDGQISLLGFKGLTPKVHIPEEIQGQSVTEIGKKAFLSNKCLQEVFFPKDILKVGEWAFAYCNALKKIWMPRKRIDFGKGAFLQCAKLEEVCLGKEGVGQSDGVGFLLAAAVNGLEDPYLFRPDLAGNEEWLELWDKKLIEVMATPDRDGYVNTILCGEEDIGSMDSNLGFFLSQKRRKKSRLALIRLLNDKGLSDKNREFLSSYVKGHMKGQKHEEAWEVVLTEYGEKRDCFELLFEIGALNADNFDAALADMGDGLAQTRAYLLRIKDKWLGSKDFFDGLSL